MLKLAGSADFDELKQFCSRDNFGARVFSRLLFDPEQRISQVMFGRNDKGHISCAVSIKDGFADVCGILGNEEIECLKFFGCRTLFMSEKAAESSGLECFSSGIVGVLTSPVKTDISDTEFISPETLRDIFPVIKDSLPESDREIYGEWYVEMSYKLRHNLTEIAAVRENGAVVSAAAASALTEEAAVIGLVRTAKDFRRRGYGTRVCSLLGQKFYNQGKKIYVCARREVFPFYEKMGYNKSDVWWYCKL